MSSPGIDDDVSSPRAASRRVGVAVSSSVRRTSPSVEADDSSARDAVDANARSSALERDGAWELSDVSSDDGTEMSEDARAPTYARGAHGAALAAAACARCELVRSRATTEVTTTRGWRSVCDLGTDGTTVGIVRCRFR